MSGGGTAVGVIHVVDGCLGTDDGVEAVVGVVVADAVAGGGESLGDLCQQVASAVVGVECGESARVGALQQLSQCVIFEGGHRTQRGDGLHLLLARACQGGHGDAVGVGVGGHKIRVGITETVI